MPIKVANDIFEEMVDDLNAELNAGIGASGVIEFWEGSLPANCEAGEGGGDTLLATLTCPNPAFGAPSANVFQLSSVTPGSVSVTGTVGYWRIKDGSNVCKMQGDAGTISADMNFNSINWTASETLAVDFLILTCTFAGTS